MDIFYCKYFLKVMGLRNSKDSESFTGGVYLKSSLGGYADYKPHLFLGDITVDRFLKELTCQSSSVAVQKTLWFLRKNIFHEFFQLEHPCFYNHHLVLPRDNLSNINRDVVKVKLQSEQPYDFLQKIKGLSKNQLIRIDANGIFDEETLQYFFSQIGDELCRHVDYIEDPLTNDKPLPRIPVAVADDFLTSSVASQTKVYKPNREFFPHNYGRVIYSSNMCHTLGQFLMYFDYCHFSLGNEFHGMIIPKVYEEQVEDLFIQRDFQKYSIDHQRVLELREQLYALKWEYLCSL